MNNLHFFESSRNPKSQCAPIPHCTPLFFLRPNTEKHLSVSCINPTGRWWPPGLVQSVDRFQFQTVVSGRIVFPFRFHETTRYQTDSILQKCPLESQKRNARSTNPFELSLQISPGINHIEWTRQHQPAARNTNKPAQVRGRSVCGPSDSSFIGIVVFCRPPPA